MDRTLLTPVRVQEAQLELQPWPAPQLTALKDAVDRVLEDARTTFKRRVTLTHSMRCAGQMDP